MAPPTKPAKRVKDWIITDHDATKKHQKELAKRLKEDPCVIKAIFACEKGTKTKKKHLQGFVSLKNGKTMSATKKALNIPKAHLEEREGTPYEAWVYCEKESKPFIIKGKRPPKSKSKPKVKSIWPKIQADINAGFTEYELMKKYFSSYLRYSTGIAKAIFQRDIHEKLNVWKDVTVTYIHGPTGSGKTRMVIEMAEKPSDVYRVTSYSDKQTTRYPFDAYQGQDIILFEEFRSNLKLEDMLIYLDGYHCTLPCRYADKISNFTKVYIATNIPLSEQYPNVQANHPESYDALKRRIDHELELKMPGDDVAKWF